LGFKAEERKSNEENFAGRLRGRKGVGSRMKNERKEESKKETKKENKKENKKEKKKEMKKEMKEERKKGRKKEGGQGRHEWRKRNARMEKLMDGRLERVKGGMDGSRDYWSDAGRMDGRTKLKREKGGKEHV
jgi:hypothetical protein